MYPDSQTVAIVLDVSVDSLEESKYFHLLNLLVILVLVAPPLGPLVPKPVPPTTLGFGCNACKYKIINLEIWKIYEID